ncbi:MAG: Coenzyme F420 hydrogenase/dehydrogenase, beta subunit C-terminal domain [Eubacteriales bacterium]|nr:Coenzyme F420 hydrogenase/dehydrogenase, beta subunit C-terminal domain [Eubacteriales bacterium]
MIDGIEKILCTGCKMCADICPNLAISYETDKKGFWYPRVEEQKCNQCGLCIQYCPGLSGFISDKQAPMVYSAWLRDDVIRLKSTSGGIYSALARQYINEEKYIVGCQYTDDYKGAFHAIYNTNEGLEKIIGSKYFQSDTAGIYKEIKILLDGDKEVLFCGTPCQSAALQKYLSKSYPNLITIDFICRGVSSPTVYYKYISELEEKFNSRVKSVHMKNKRAGWESLGFCVRFRNGREYYRKGKDDLWVQGFLQGSLYTRPACHHCKYRNLPRVSDISLGDFWGISGVEKDDLFKGISLVMVNSAKGEALFEQIMAGIAFQERSLDEAVQGNPSIFYNNPRGERSELFFELLDSMSISESIKRCLKNNDNKIVERNPKKIARRIYNVLSSIDLIKFIYYNFFSKCIVREKNCYLMTYKNSVVNLDKSARVHIKNGTIKLGTYKLRGSKAETYLRMGKNAKWISNGDAELFYNTQVEIQENAVLESGYFTANCGTVIVCAKKITLGENIMLGRNIIIYDSDYHQIVDRNGNMINYDAEVTIEDNVWLTSNVTVLRGVTIGEGSIITAQTVIKKDLPPHSLAEGCSSVKVTKIDKVASWSRESTHKY